MPTKPLILCVDDEKNVLSALERCLKTSFDVLTANTPGEGLKIYSEKYHDISVVISDLKMPDMNGIEFLKKIKQISTSSVCLMLTGTGGLNDAIEAINQNLIWKYINKPWENKNLIELISSAVEKKIADDIKRVERRENVRYPFFYHFSICSPKPKQFYDCLGGNISVEGMEILSPVSFCVNENIDIRAFYNSEPLKVLDFAAKVVWRDEKTEIIDGQEKYPIKVEFSAISDEQKQKLKYFLDMKPQLIKTITFQYCFNLETGIQEKFPIYLNVKNLQMLNTIPSDLPKWADRKLHRCPNCRLTEDSIQYCPLAVRLVDICDRFKQFNSTEQIYIDIFTPERVISHKSFLQTGISSLIFLIIAVSGCPNTAFLKPMARFHLPFPSEYDQITVHQMEEIIFRSVSTYLLNQYFLLENGQKTDLALNEFERNYRDFHIIITNITNRLREAGVSEAVLNALVILDMHTNILSKNIKKLLKPICNYFEAAN